MSADPIREALRVVLDREPTDAEVERAAKSRGWASPTSTDTPACRVIGCYPSIVHTHSNGLPTPDALRAAARDVADHREGRHGITEYRCGQSFAAHIDVLRAALGNAKETT